MNIHRINLRGPWLLSVEGSRVSASRSFHAPSGLDGDSRTKVYLHWQTPVSSPIAELSLNGKTIPSGTLVDEGESIIVTTPATGRHEVTGILQRYNELRLVWNEPAPTMPLESGKYTPHPNHPLHSDSWLEIHEVS